MKYIVFRYVTALCRGPLSWTELMLRKRVTKIVAGAPLLDKWRPVFISRIVTFHVNYMRKSQAVTFDHKKNQQNIQDIPTPNPTQPNPQHTHLLTPIWYVLISINGLQQWRNNKVNWLVSENHRTLYKLNFRIFTSKRLIFGQLWAMDFLFLVVWKCIRINTGIRFCEVIQPSQNIPNMLMWLEHQTLYYWIWLSWGPLNTEGGSVRHRLFSSGGGSIEPI